MKQKLHRLFNVLLVGLLVTLGLTLWAAYSTVSRLKKIELASSDLDLKYFRVAAQLRAQLHRLSAAMLRHQVTGEPIFATKFSNYRNQLERFLSDQQGSLSGPAERELMNQIAEGLAAYFEEADRAIGDRRSGKQPEVILARIEASREVLDEVIELTNQLSESRQQSFRLQFGEYQGFAERIQHNAPWWFAIMLGLLTMISWIAYRLFVAPLNQELEQAKTLSGRRNELASIGTLAAGLAHEIRNPITAMKARIFALTELAQENKAAVKQAHFVDNELNRLEVLVKDFLNYARPSDPVPEWIDLSSFLQDMFETLKPEVSAVGHELRLELGKVQKVFMDGQQVRQIIFNLVRNAQEACGETPGSITLGLTTRDGLPRIYVADNGPGIPNEFQKKLFIPFFSKKASGTGLGLSIAENLARKNRAQLNFESSQQTGTTFFIDFIE